MIKRKSIFKLKQREFASNGIAAMPKASKPSFPTKVNFNNSAAGVGKNINSNTSLSSLLSSRSSVNYTKPTGGTNNNSFSPNSSGGSVLSGASSKPTGSNPSSGGNSKPNLTGGSIFSGSKETPKPVIDKDFFDKHVGNPQPQQPQGKGKGGGGKGKGGGKGQQPQPQPQPSEEQPKPTPQPSTEGQPQPQPTTQSTQPVEGQADANTNQADSGQQEGSWLGNKWKNSGILGKTGMVGAGALGAYTAYQGLSSLMGGGRRKKRDDE